MQREEVALYDVPWMYDAVVPPGPCEDFYRGLAERAGGPVLELACGTGRLSVPLARGGREIVGLDASPAMLEAARRKADAAAVDVTFVEGDMRSFDLGQLFAVVLVSCNSLSHLTTNEELVGTLRRIARHLAPGGLLAFDVINPRVADLAQSDRTEGMPNVLGGCPAVTATRELLAYDPIAQVQVLRWQVETLDDRRRTEEMRLRTIFPQELPLLLAAAGLELVARFGDFDGNPLTSDSLNQVCIAHRALKRGSQ